MAESGPRSRPAVPRLDKDQSLSLPGCHTPLLRPPALSFFLLPPRPLPGSPRLPPPPLRTARRRGPDPGRVIDGSRGESGLFISAVGGGGAGDEEAGLPSGGAGLCGVGFECD